MAVEVKKTGDKSKRGSRSAPKGCHGATKRKTNYPVRLTGGLKLKVTAYK